MTTENNASEQPILSVRNLKTHFTTGIGKNKLVVKAVDNVNFDIYKGEVFGLVGESGCGKTTTGRTIIKLYTPTDGEVFFKGKRITAGYDSLKEQSKQMKRQARNKVRELRQEMKEALEKSSDKEQLEAQYKEKIQAVREATQAEIKNFKAEIQRRKYESMKDYKRRDTKDLMKKMQMIFQDPIASLNPRMTVKEIIAEGLRIAGETDKKVITGKVNEVLETVGLLPEHANRYPHEFSGGQRQRIGVARALIVSPELIIADEPISALDVSIQAQVINLLNDLREQFGLTILFIAHDLSVVQYFSDRIAVMYYGKLVELAPTKDLFDHPLHPYTKSLLSAVPVPDPDFEKSRQRNEYDPNMHDYEIDKPDLHEITPGHFILANNKELEEHKKTLGLT
ncbi:MAG: ATP-binding cassette domain-containing protein [Candidatus Izemoplasmataceae bacterium]